MDSRKCINCMYMHMMALNCRLINLNTNGPCQQMQLYSLAWLFSCLLTIQSLIANSFNPVSNQTGCVVMCIKGITDSGYPSFCSHANLVFQLKEKKDYCFVWTMHTHSVGMHGLVWVDAASQIPVTTQNCLFILDPQTFQADTQCSYIVCLPSSSLSCIVTEL